MNEQNTNDMDNLVSRTERLIGALTNAILSTAEVAAQRIELASKVAEARQRLAALSSVLETLGAQKVALIERQESAKGAMKALLHRQVEILEAQELSILASVGVEEPAAKAALTVVDAAPVYRRDGRRFAKEPAVLSNGHATI